MSEHWNLDGDISRRTGKPSWPQGATAGLLLVAASCLALGMVLYQLAGPRDLVEDHPAPSGR